MTIELVLGIMCVVAACSIFLGHAAGYARGKQVGMRQGYKMGRGVAYSKENNNV